MSGHCSSPLLGRHRPRNWSTNCAICSTPAVATVECCGNQNGADVDDQQLGLLVDNFDVADASEHVERQAQLKLLGEWPSTIDRRWRCRSDGGVAARTLAGLKQPLLEWRGTSDRRLCWNGKLLEK